MVHLQVMVLYQHHLRRHLDLPFLLIPVLDYQHFLRRQDHQIQRLALHLLHLHHQRKLWMLH